MVGPKGRGEGEPEVAETARAVVGRSDARRESQIRPKGSQQARPI
jgi:hypothetical protein